MVKRSRGRPIGSIGPRDHAGWLVPKPGTRSRIVYEMLKAGLETHIIARSLTMSKCNVHQIIFRIRHPDQTKDQHREYMANRKDLVNVTT